MKSKMENAHAGADILAFFSRMLKNGHMQRKFPLFGPPQTMERYYDGVFGSYIDQIFAHNLVISHVQADSSCGCQNRGERMRL
jgi:hypothetical protein